MAHKIVHPNPLPKDSILPPEWHHKLSSLYSQPIRAYHTLEHISSLLTLLKEHSIDVYDRDSIEWAVWFHEYVTRNVINIFVLLRYIGKCHIRPPGKCSRL